MIDLFYILRNQTLLRRLINLISLLIPSLNFTLLENSSLSEVTKNFTFSKEILSQRSVFGIAKDSLNFFINATD